ncbi:MAG: DNA repair protein RecN [Anaerolineae bacterium]
MLTELTIANFAIIDRLALKFDGGLNVLTGETGAGKSIIIDAMILLLGGRADTNLIRSGTGSARIEGVFQLADELRARIGPILEREGLEDDDPGLLVLGREVRNTGRSFCRVNGRTVNLSILRQIAEPLVDIHGQNEHLSLMRVREHQRFLDRYGELDAQRAEMAQQVRRLRAVQKELAELVQNEAHLARRMDQLAYQVEEIEAANLQPGEEETLGQERTRLANAEQLGQLSAEAYRTLFEGEEDYLSAADLIGQVTKTLTNLARLDGSLEGQVQAANDLAYQAQELAATLRDYADAIEFNPARLQEVEERLGLIYNLKRKYGQTIEEILAFGQGARQELETISHSEERIAELRQEEEALRHRVGALAQALSEARQAAAQALTGAIERQVADLGMDQARFKIDLQRTPDPNGVYVGQETFACDERGLDRVEFLIAPNPGEPFKPLVKVASGGETSRVMLALKTVLALADETPTLIFDEIDQGIGGRIGGVVGRKLWALAHQADHQVLCVTHLPQIAGYGDVHYHVSKQVVGDRTQTHIRELRQEERVEELAQMLGTPSESTRRSAAEILGEAEAVKENGVELGEGVAQAALL